ncbi:MAG: quinolinate synthase NadA [Elusimicrobia bacterium]|nr:quinolinate synthase NadA [Elusimicrobiota bacterium]
MEKIIKKIQELKKKRNAVILAHNYQIPEVQDVADFLGDSLGLSRRAAETQADVIVFCGVHFMAETAAILSPEKTVLIPDREAGCPMADMIGREKLLELKRENPGALVVSYVNTTAEVKSETDVCCTSANAVEIVNALKDRDIIFVPDKYLGSFAAAKTGKKMILFNGYCPVHMKILPQDIKKAKEKHPRAAVIVHPECRTDVVKLADAVVSTSGMVRFVKETDAEEFIIGTETGIVYRLQKENPDKKIYPASEIAVCENMKKITLEKVLWSLEELKYEVRVEEKIRKKALKSIEKMIEIG